MKSIKFRNFVMRHLIPKWYTEKYKSQIGNRKHSSGYWFEFIIPRVIVPRYDFQQTKNYYQWKTLYRWLNFYFVRTKGYNIIRR